MKTILYLVAIVCVFAVIGTAGALECGSITIANAVGRVCVLLPIGLVSVVIAKRI